MRQTSKIPYYQRNVNRFVSCHELSLEPESYLRIDATSMIKGISSENPAELLVRCILAIWSAYDVTGDVMRLYSTAMVSIIRFIKPFANVQKLGPTHKNGAPYSRIFENKYIVTHYLSQIFRELIDKARIVGTMVECIRVEQVRLYCAGGMDLRIHGPGQIRVERDKTSEEE